MRSGWKISRRDRRLVAVFALALMTVTLFAAFREGVDAMMRDLATSGAVVPVPAGDRYGTRFAGSAEVIAGDRLVVGNRRVQLHGVIAPAPEQTCPEPLGQGAYGSFWRCGSAAARKLESLIGGRPVTCVMQRTDPGGRARATCRTVTINLNAAMVLNGYALADRRDTSRYVPEESVAKHLRRGIWAGGVADPKDWQEGER